VPRNYNAIRLTSVKIGYLAGLTFAKVRNAAVEIEGSRYLSARFLGCPITGDASKLPCFAASYLTPRATGGQDLQHQPEKEF
jgi:hypothetical protein